MEFLSKLPEYLVVAMAVVGSLSLLARYTPWKWDDKLFKSLEKGIKTAQKFFPKSKKDK